MILGWELVKSLIIMLFNLLSYLSDTIDVYKYTLCGFVVIRIV